MNDVDINPDETSPYECFACGTITAATDNPGTCPDCAGPMRNRWTPIE